ncbi:MAG: ThiF family adenylyltransferase [Candidatus Paceibacterota bacterium]
MNNQDEYSLFQTFKDTHKDVTYINTLGEQKHELMLVRDPSLISHDALGSGQNIPTEENEGVWVYFPWRNTAVRILPEGEYSELRLSRNKNLITQDEQTMLAKSCIAIAGLNVGNPGAICIALEGISNNIKLADFDPLSVSNLNRFRAGLPDLGVNKAYISARQIYEINPYAKIEVYGDGITNDNMESFLNNPKIDILVEETDNLKLKVSMREQARKLKIPVVMVTGNGENVIVDIERYDLEPELPLLAGYLDDIVLEGISKVKAGEGTYQERIDLARDFMGVEYLDSRLVSSFGEVGKTLAGIPQLAESSFLRGATIAHFTKKILLREPLVSGRYVVLLSGSHLGK